MDRTKFEAVADGQFNVTKNMISVFGQAGNIVGKGENADYQHFLLSLQWFQKASSSGSLKKLELCGKESM